MLNKQIKFLRKLLMLNNQIKFLRKLLMLAFQNTPEKCCHNFRYIKMLFLKYFRKIKTVVFTKIYAMFHCFYSTVIMN